MNTKPLVFIVDDDPGMRSSIELLLENQGYDLVFFENGKSLLAALPESQPDVILLDVMMPEISGFEVCERIRKTPLYEGIPIIMITALDSKEDKLQGIEAGADDFLAKPYDHLELRARIKLITRLNRYRKIVVAEKRLRWTVENAQEGYLIINEKDEILYTNQAARAYLQIPDVDHLREPLKFLSLAKEHYECYPDYNWEGWPGALLYPERDRLLVHPETEISLAIWLRADILPTSIPGNSEFLLRLQDVSERITNQRELYSFHAALNHKLRTPIGQMILALEVLHLQAAGKTPELAQMSQSALAQAKTLSSRIGSILKYVNFSTVCDLKNGIPVAQIGEIIANLQDNLGIADLDFHTEPVLCESALVLSAQSMETILWELVENAVKFHPEHTPGIKISIQQTPDRAARIDVVSIGTRLPLQALERVWEPYFQSEKLLTGEVPGMGMGLAIVSNILCQCRGKYAMQNLADGSGVVAQLTIPLA